MYTPLQARGQPGDLGILLFIALFLELLLITSSFVSFIPIVETVRMAMVIIGIVPNGLFLSMKRRAYALGVVCIVGKGALVQKFNAIYLPSHVDVLCLDKTGTLTANKLELASLYPYATDKATLSALLGSYVAHTSSSNVTSEAIGAACQEQTLSGFPVRQEIPFSSARKWSALVLMISPYVESTFWELQMSPSLSGARQRSGNLRSRRIPAWATCVTPGPLS